MRCILKSGLSLACGLLLASGATAQTKVKIIAFNDFHGNLQSPGSFALVSGGPRNAAGGVDYLAGYVESLKAENPNSVVVSAGDLVGASPLISAFFHDEGTIETMNRLGLDFSSVGNHEFDAGVSELLRKQEGGCHPTGVNTCEGASVGTPVPFEGAQFKFLAANVIDNATGRTLLPAYGIKTFQGHRIAFIGMTLQATPSIVSPAGVAGLTFNDEAATVNALVPRLRERGVEVIVVIVHQGGFQGSTAPNYINDCSQALGDPSTSPIKAIVSRLDDAVDLVISGHTHIGYVCQLPNSVGRLIPVTQASSFGRLVTNIDLTLNDDTGGVASVTATNVVVDRTNTSITPDATIASIVSGYNTLVSPLANQVVATIMGPVTSTSNAAGEKPAGDLIADAQLAATAPAQFGGSVVAFMNPGGVRGAGFVNTATVPIYPYDITYGNAFTVQPFGNALVTMTLTSQQIKDTLEQEFAGCNGQTSNRILQVSTGFSFSWSQSAPPCSKVSSVVLNGLTLVDAIGVVLNPNLTFRVTVNNFLSPGGDGFTTLKGGTNLVGGAQDIDALVAYLASFKSPNPPYNPATITSRVTLLP